MTPQNIDELRRYVTGAVLTPVDPQYDGARGCFNALVDRRPAVIVRCLGAADVAVPEPERSAPVGHPGEILRS